jgi:hypothetical protein
MAELAPLSCYINYRRLSALGILWCVDPRLQYYIPSPDSLYLLLGAGSSFVVGIGGTAAGAATALVAARRSRAVSRNGVFQVTRLGEYSFDRSGGLRNLR